MAGRILESLWSFIKKNIITLIIAVTAVSAILYGVRDAGKTSSVEEKRIAEESIRRAVVTCYAIEGSYPPSYDYIKENYGVQIDEDKYQVFYEVFASNIMPDITVLTR